ncbi:MAG: DUF5320 domain-containing protein [Promethearchaeia archaeon]
MAYYYGRGSGWGRGRGGSLWPGNGPFSHLPPWERPGWLYGPGSCWALGYWGTSPTGTTGVAPSVPMSAQTELQALERQKEVMEQQIKSLEESLNRIEERLGELED